MFVIHGFILAFLDLVLSAIHIFLYFMLDEKINGSLWTSFLTLAVSAFGSLFLGNLTFLHIKLLWNNRSTKEKLNERYLDIHDPNPFTKHSLIGNCKKQLCSKIKESMFYSTTYPRGSLSFSANCSSNKIFPESLKPDTQRATLEASERELYRLKMAESSRRPSQYGIRVDESAIKTLEEKSRHLARDVTLERSVTSK